MRTNIVIPDDFKDVAIKNGARFDAKKNGYYIPEDVFISVFNQFIPLTIELIPASNWMNNVRSEFKDDWDWIRRSSYKKAGYRCEVCNGVGPNHPVECHEIWEFDTDEKVQKLVGLISLCPTCHKVKHIGLAFTNGEGGIAIEQLKTVNNWGDDDVAKYIEESFLIYEALSRIDWILDLSYLSDIIRETKCN